MRYELHRGFFLAAQCANVSDEVNGQYVIGFYPETTDGKWHKLNVTVGGQQQNNLEIFARKDYYSPSIRGRQNKGIVRQ